MYAPVLEGGHGKGLPLPCALSRVLAAHILPGRDGGGTTAEAPGNLRLFILTLIHA